MNTATPTPSTPASFTAAQIAAALACARQAIQQRLAAVQADTSALVSGNEAAAWHLDTLPHSLRVELETAAKRQYYRDALHLLSCPGEPWKPAVPLDKVKPERRAEAVKLRAALQKPLEQYSGPVASDYRPELQRLGLDEYQKIFGYPISVKHWWRLFDRTINRDRGQRHFDRLDLYLAENAGQSDPGPRLAAPTFNFAPLSEVIRQFDNPEKPSASDRAHFFHAAFEHYETLCAANPGRLAQKLIKNALLDWMLKAVPSLSRTQKALRRAFEIKLNLWCKNGKTIDAIEDLRPVFSGNKCRLDFAADKKKLRDRAIMLDGNESLAFRQLWKDRQFSPEFMDRYEKFDPRVNKSNVPDAIRQEVTRQVESILPYHHGPRAARLAGPSIMRNYDNVAPGDWFSADDWTPEIYFWSNDENGQPQIMRGECLLFIDVRSLYPLGFKLIAGHYNSEHIRSSILRVHDVHGLPHKGFQFENGVWRGKLVESVGQGALQFRETERGLAAPGIGLRIRRTYLPRGKVIEGIFNILQNTQRNLPGYCGPNEQVQKMERLNEFKKRVTAGKAHPGEELLEMSQWVKMLDKACAEYANDPQNGRMLPGKTPAEMWQQRQPLRKLPDEGRYILATHQVKTTIRGGQIWITIRGQKRNYFNDQISQRDGQQILAFYNVEQPDLLTCCDMNKTNFFAAVHRELPAFDATREQFAAVNTERNAHQRHVRAEYDSIPHAERLSIVRDNVISESDRQLGEQHNAAVQEHRETSRKLRKINRDAAALGLPVNHHVRNPDRVRKGIDLTTSALERLERRQQETEQP